MLALLLDSQLFPSLMFAAGGLVLVVLNMLAGRGRMGTVLTWIGAAAALASCGVGIAGCMLQWTPALWLPPLVLAGIYVAFFVLPSPEVAAGFYHFAALLRRRHTRTFGLLVAIGLAVVVSIIQVGGSSEAEHPWVPATMPEAQRHLQEVSANVFTDRGQRIVMSTNTDPQVGHLDAAGLQRQSVLLTQKGLRDQVIHLSLGLSNSNCHGWTFTGGKYWVTGDQVETILKDNGYRLKPTAKGGDLVVYRSSQGAVTHTGIVRYVNAGTGLILVESKWGSMGRFIHPCDAHPYLPDVATFYRSQRSGHLLAGVTSGAGSTSVPPSYELNHLSTF